MCLKGQTYGTGLALEGRDNFLAPKGHQDKKHWHASIIISYVTRSRKVSVARREHMVRAGAMRDATEVWVKCLKRTLLPPPRIYLRKTQMQSRPAAQREP